MIEQMGAKVAADQDQGFSCWPAFPGHITIPGNTKTALSSGPGYLEMGEIHAVWCLTDSDPK